MHSLAVTHGAAVLIFFASLPWSKMTYRVALEPILFTSNFWRAKNWQKFGKFQILAVVALDQHVLSKTSLIDIHVTRSTDNKTSRTLIVQQISFESLTLRRFFSLLHVLDSPLSSNASFLAPNGTSNSLGLLVFVFVLSLPSLAIEEDRLAEAVS